MSLRVATIETLLKREPPACACEQCRNMCRIPCWGTPADIRRIIDAGYGDRLSIDCYSKDPAVYFLLPAVKGYEGKVTPRNQTGHGQGCTFWTADKLCSLHDAGLKPTEGRMAHHHPVFKHGDWLQPWIGKQWDTDEGRALVNEWGANYAKERG